MEKVGCFIVFIILAVLLLSTDHPVLYGILFVAVVSFLVWIESKFKEPKTSSTKSKSQSGKATYSETGQDKEIDRDYFEKISKVVDDMMTVYDSAISSQEFRDAASEGIVLHDGDETIKDPTNKIQYLFWVDMAHCGRGLHLPYDRLDKTSYALFYFMERTMGGKRLSYDNYRDLYRSSNHIMAETALKECYFSYHDAEDSIFFMVAHILDKIDELQKQKYLVLLYRFASIMAKADNTVTEEEAKFLNSIMQLQSDGNNIAVAGDVDMPETEYYKAPLSGDFKSRKALDDLIGLESVKQDVTALTNYIRIQNARSQKGLKASPITYHCVFTGNPGTGKTTVARILANIYKELGVVSKGHLVETDRSGLVGEYVGQTAVKTNKVIDHALGGVLFIDEAYSLLGDGKDYGREAIATLLKRMEDDRKRLVVILAGYTNEMKAFINSNPGLQSRFSRYIEFPDYNADELYQIFLKRLKEFEYTITPEAAVALKAYFSEAVAHKDANFGNARFVRNVFERTLQHQANRLSSEVNLTSEKLAEITKEDLPIEG
ncbi:MAG: AAA family ATPase [Bacteroidales bacterium]|nr:AAA family ATPase [Bacteroidales bacterium]MBR4488652.1 AAA family ATPase [Bacteroidales bacterium]